MCSKIDNKLPIEIRTLEDNTVKQLITVFLTKHAFYNCSEYIEGKWALSDLI